MENNKNSHWNYRIVKTERIINGRVDNYYGIHEVYYTNNIPDLYIETPIIIGDTIEELHEILNMIKNDMNKDQEVLTNGQFE